jgi:ABC-type glycerol-3-phosphate transport system permease component
MTAATLRSTSKDPRRAREMAGRVGWGIVAWVVAIAFFIPVLWMVITAFKPAQGGGSRIE